MQNPNNPNATWEIAVPPGTYNVRIVAGDPGQDNSVYQLDAEGTRVLTGTPSASVRWIDQSATVTVTDGRLTISNSIGAANNKIAFIDIDSVGGGGGSGTGGSGTGGSGTGGSGTGGSGTGGRGTGGAGSGGSGAGGATGGGGATSFTARINFQPAGVPVPSGYNADTGAVFAARANGLSYGWNIDNSAQARDRDSATSPDQRYDTLTHMQNPNNPNASWEIAVPPGTYNVRIVAGDPGQDNSVYQLDAEGTRILTGTPSASVRWIDQSATVTVTDGRLTISNSIGAANNKIAFIDIDSVGGGSGSGTGGSGDRRQRDRRQGHGRRRLGRQRRRRCHGRGWSDLLHGKDQFPARRGAGAERLQRRHRRRVRRPRQRAQLRLEHRQQRTGPRSRQRDLPRSALRHPHAHAESEQSQRLLGNRRAPRHLQRSHRGGRPRPGQQRLPARCRGNPHPHGHPVGKRALDRSIGHGDRHRRSPDHLQQHRRRQ